MTVILLGILGASVWASTGDLTLLGIGALAVAFDTVIIYCGMRGKGTTSMMSLSRARAELLPCGAGCLGGTKFLSLVPSLAASVPPPGGQRSPLRNGPRRTERTALWLNT